VSEPSKFDLLIQEMWLGEPDHWSALERIYKELRPFLVGRAYRCLGNETQAGDAADEALTRVVQLLLDDPAKFRNPSHLAGYLHQTLSSKIVDSQRRRGRYVMPQDDQELQRMADEFGHRVSAEAEGKSLSENERDQLIRNALNSLKPVERLAVELFYLKGFSGVEAGRQMGVSHNAFRVRLMRSMDKLKTWATRRRAQ
jgi:RNA polymerase sigma factor (sigma-70 family)